MKKIFLILSTLATLAAHASNYPADYTYQTARVVTRGSFVLAYVGSGIGSTYLLGYKWSGNVAQTNPDHIDAVISTTCTLRDGSVATKKSTVSLGREWHGTGFMSMPLNGFYDFYSDGCRYQNDAQKGELQIAFTDNQGNWDSLFGYNYRINESTIYSNEAVTYSTGESGPYNSSTINDKAWGFIVDQMRK